MAVKTAISLLLFIFSVIAPIAGKPAAIRRRIIPAGRIVAPFPPFSLGLRRRFYVYEYDVDPDFRNILQIDKEVGFAPPKPPSSRHDDAQHFTFRIGKYYVAYPAEPFSVAEIDSFFLFQFT